MSELVFETLGEQPVDYLEAWQRQREVHAQVVEGGPGTVLLLEHSPVYTAGKRTEPHERPADGTPVIEVDRGGKITFHGPGQLVGYPIVRLPDHVLVVDFVRRLEEALIGVCADLGVTTARVPGRSGVWLEAGSSTTSGAPRPERKIAAIGIRVSRGVTMHGFALNCDVDLSWYDRFVPCGIADAGVTTCPRNWAGTCPLPRCSRWLSGTWVRCWRGRRTSRPRTTKHDRSRVVVRLRAPTPRACVFRSSIRLPEPSFRHAGACMAEGCVDNP